ncbi:LOG family protein [Patescibacteria group bacterium]
MAKTKNIAEKEFGKKHFRVTIFGSARIKKGDEIYKQAYELSKEIGKQGFDIVTGGGPGLMEAANSGHMAGDKDNKSSSIGITIELPFEASSNPHLEVEKHFQKFSGRLDQFMAISNAIILFSGGIGSCLELFYTWQLTQVKHINSLPIILMGDMWKDLLKWMRSWPLKKGYMSESDFNNICIATDTAQALRIIMETNNIYMEAGDKYSINFNKYK